MKHTDDPPITETDRRLLNTIMCRLNTSSHDLQRQIDDLRERLAVLERAQGLDKPGIDWERGW
jgi:hypothetical protein